MNFVLRISSLCRARQALSVAVLAFAVEVVVMLDVDLLVTVVLVRQLRSQTTCSVLQQQQWDESIYDQINLSRLRLPSARLC